ncbi:MAG: VWA domain-containing protein [Ignavibacteriota bacterium]
MRVRLVLLDVSVTDRNGAFVPGLSKENFTVSEMTRASQSPSSRAKICPVTVGLLMDESQSMGNKRDDVLAAANTLIAEGNPQDETFVLNFNDRVRRGLPEGQLFSSDIQQLNDALYRGHPMGRTALYDALFDGLSQLDLGHRDKKALVLISDGGDNASHHLRREVFDKLDRSIATVYAVGLYDAEDPDRDPRLLRHIAGVSGGEAFFPASSASMTDVCRGIAKDIRTRYTVGYAPSTSNGGALRRIHIRVVSPTHGRTGSARAYAVPI